MLKDHIDLVQTQLEAYNEADLLKFCSCYHPEVIVTKLPEDSPVIQGMSELLQTYEQLFRANPNQSCHLESRIVSGEFIVDEEIIYGRKSHPEGFKARAIYGFRDGLIDRVWFT